MRVEDLRKSFGRLEVLKGISLDVREGEVIGIIGRVGERQIHAAALHQSPGNAHVGTGAVSGRGDHARRTSTRRGAHIGMVFQRFNLFPHLTALQNVMLAPCKALRQPPAQAEAAGAQSARSGASGGEGR